MNQQPLGISKRLEKKAESRGRVLNHSKNKLYEELLWWQCELNLWLSWLSLNFCLKWFIKVRQTEDGHTQQVQTEGSDALCSLSDLYAGKEKDKSFSTHCLSITHTHTHTMSHESCANSDGRTTAAKPEDKESKHTYTQTRLTLHASFSAFKYQHTLRDKRGGRVSSLEV